MKIPLRFSDQHASPEAGEHVTSPEDLNLQQFVNQRTPQSSQQAHFEGKLGLRKFQAISMTARPRDRTLEAFFDRGPRP